ncbi:MAG TPA: hypothetical protein PKA63_11380 [Oligoflexia bacterium]|nr:hypothetical protein [Oligoflexia bacterium]HMP49260.1 hypothetical protein [Oligoflexia bacterium]
MSALVTEKTIVWKLSKRNYPTRSGEYGSIVLRNEETGELREVAVRDLRGAGCPGFTIWPRYSLADDGVFYAVR